ncbi:transcriptional regulator with XRE-family HTH domain [Marmoricola sp. URHA0025 HA25]
METRLKASRQARGWSQLHLVAELERACTARGIGPPTRASLKTQVSRWENGHIEPDDLYSSLLAEVYGTTPADLGLRSQSTLWEPRAGALGRPSAELVESLRGVLNEYTRTDNAVGPGHLIGLSVQHVVELQQLALNARGSLRGEIMALCSRFAEFAGWLCQDAGDLLEAERWTDRALDFIEGSDDAQARAYLLMRKSAVAAERGEPLRAVNLAEAASGRDAAQLNLKLQAVIARQLAIAHALSGNAPESDRAAETAVGLVVTDGEDTPNELAYCTPAYVLMETGAAAARLRSYDLAADRLSEAVSSWPDGFRRDQGLAVARLAIVEATRGEIDIACELGKRALDLAAVASSARTLALLKSLEKRLARHRRSTVVTEFRSYAGKPD